MSSGPGENYAVTRRYERFKIDIPVVLRHVQHPESGERHERTRSMGEGGLCAVIAADVAPGELVELEFTLPDERETLRVRAIARYRAHLYHGFEFVRLSADEAELVRAALAGAPPQP